MPDVRNLGFFGLGVASGVAGAWVWFRPQPPGKVLQIGDAFFLEPQVRDELLRRVIGAKGEMDRSAAVPLRGAVLRLRPEGSLFRVSLDGQGTLGDVLGDLIAFGLARRGGRYNALPRRGDKPAPLELGGQATEHKGTGEIGHVFQNGDKFYADEPFLKTLESFGSSDFDAAKDATIVPIFRRGALHLRHLARARVLPEQIGSLYEIEPALTGVTLPDLINEFVQYGLVAWGGAWDRFPISLPRGTGAPPLEPRGHVFRVKGELYIDQPVMDLLRTRAEWTTPPKGTPGVIWHGALLTPQPANVPRYPDQVGALYHLGPDRGVVGDFGADLVLHRLARHVTVAA